MPSEQLARETQRVYLTPGFRRDGPTYHTDPDCPNLPDDHTETDLASVDQAMSECGRCSGEMEQNGGPDTLYHQLRRADP